MKNLMMSFAAALMIFTILTTPTRAQERTGVIQQKLNVASDTVWGGPVKVCWETPGFILEKILVRFNVLNTWEAASGVRFTGWDTCECSDSANIRIKISDEHPHTKGMGSQLNRVSAGMVLNFTFNNWPNNKGCATSFENKVNCIRAIAVHEFGHALGFAHEQNRIDTTCETPRQGPDGNRLVGAWDLSSVMNYCNPRWSNHAVLSETDIEGARIFYGLPNSLKVGLPNGSYSQTCVGAAADADTLYATCLDKRGEWWKTSLSNYKACGGEITNLDGILACPTNNPPPGGSYRLTCNDAVADNVMLQATCMTMEGEWQKTSLANYKHCTSDIWNSDGNLTCLKNNPPAGSYQQTCANVIAEGNSLFATCMSMDGNRDRTSIADFRRCTGDIWNSNGLLRCINNMAPPNGSYKQSCNDLFVNGKTLSAHCQTIGGHWRKTNLLRFDLCKSDIGNNDGNLSCVQ